MPSKGLRQYHPQEVSNINFNGLGFDIVTRSHSLIANYTEYTPPEGYIFVGIQSINGVGKIQARKVLESPRIPGDNLSLSGSYDKTPANSSDMILMISADTIYGRFDRVVIWKDEVGTNNAQFKFILGK